MKIVIIEDDISIIDSLSLIIHMIWPECVIISSGLGYEGLNIIKTKFPDAVILDIELPDISGFDILKQVRMFSNLPILVLTVRDSEEDIVKGLETGANDYLVKPFRQMEFLARLKLMLKKQEPLNSGTPINIGNWSFDPIGHKIISNNIVIHLTSTECAILSHLALNKGKIVTFSSLANLLWQDKYPGYREAIQVYIWRLRKKIEVDVSHPNIIHTKIGIGYYLE
jgi:two-component system KDP operon response regulator KdpE